MIAVPLQILATTVVAARLLVRSFETRQRHELLLGLFYLCSGSLGFGLLLISALFVTTEPALAPTISRISVVFNLIGAGALMLFVRMSFRPDTPWLRWIIALGGLGLVGAALHVMFMAELPFPGPREPLQWIRFILGIAILSWATVESLRKATQLQKRERLGLGDPVLKHRFFVWALSPLSFLVNSVFSLTGYVIADDPAAFMVANSEIFLVVVLIGSVGAWLAFLPPRLYLRWLENRRASA